MPPAAPRQTYTYSTLRPSFDTEDSSSTSKTTQLPSSSQTTIPMKSHRSLLSYLSKECISAMLPSLWKLEKIRWIEASGPDLMETIKARILHWR
jgi:hypothetical protein